MQYDDVLLKTTEQKMIEAIDEYLKTLSLDDFYLEMARTSIIMHIIKITKKMTK